MSTNTKIKKGYGKVAVLMGGMSAEREISLNSGGAVLNALLTNEVDAHAVDVGENVIQQLTEGQYDCVFNMLHGRGGEDGVIQGALELLGLPYTGSGVMASALGMDKLKTKEIWLANELPTPAYYVVDSNTSPEDVLKKLRLPIIIKPMREGSSIGISKVSVKEDLAEAMKNALQYDSSVLAEQWIEGDEYTAGIIGDVSLPLIRLETSNTFYDYDAKYQSNSTQYHCPCELDVGQERALQELAIKAFNAVGASDWGRVDLMVDGDDKAYLIEVNTLPGMTDHSLVPIAAKQAGIDFNHLVMKILEQSLKTN